MANNSGSKVLLFLINPFISSIDSLIHIRDKQSQKLLYLWFLVFGAAFCAVSETSDSYYFAQDFLVESKYTISQYLNIVSDYFLFGTGVKDLYTVTVNFIVGRFTDNYHWTFFIYSIVFGIFYLKSLNIFLRYDCSNNAVFYFLLFLFCFSNPIFNINGMRFWTASWIGTFVALKVILDKDYKYLLLLIITPLIHNSFYIWIFAIFMALLTWRFKKLWSVLFVLSSFVSAVSFLDILDDFSYLLPDFLQQQVWNYTESEGALDKINGTGAYASIPLYAKVLTALPNYFVLILSFIILFENKEICKTAESNRYYCIFLVLFSIVNFLSSIPSVYRFQKTLIPILLILWLANEEELKKYRWLFFLVPVVYAYKLRYFIPGVIKVTELPLYIAPAPFTIFYYLLF